MATQTRNPTSEVAVTGTWSGTNRHLLLDDHPDSGNPIADGTTCSAAGVAVYGFSVFSVPAGSTAISVQVLYEDFKNGSQGSTIGAAIRCNDTTNRLSGTHNPGNGNANIALRTDNYATNPKSAANWTVDDVNGVGANGLTSFGQSVTDANPTVTVSSTLLQVTYIPPVTGDLAATEAQDTAAATGTVEWSAVLAATESSDAAAATGTVEWIAALAATEAQDSAAMSGDVSGGDITGDLATTEVQDSASMDGAVAWYANLAATEGQDVAAANGTVAWILVLTATEAQDSASMSGDNGGDGSPTYRAMGYRRIRKGIGIGL